jgi:peptidoglycan/LPS O-acetylase OafA/YrhL
MPTKKETNYLYFLDGLRAVAILAVLTFHFDNTWLSGGFLGVEIFFVISGFIITKLLLDEWQKTGEIDLKRFWLRRLRRLIPAAFTVILATWICVLLWFPEEINQIFEDLFYSLTFTNNWNYIVNERSYFDLIGRPRLFEHLWSLGVEFQFYVFWALFCGILFRLQKSVSATLIIIFSLASTILMATLFNPEIDPSRIYFGTDTRISALFIGGIVAILLRENNVDLSTVDSFFLNLITFIGVMGLASFCFFAKSSDAFLFQGGFLAVSVLTASVIASCLQLSKQQKIAPILWVLSNKPMRFIGIRAYGIYLWHWAIFALTQPFVDVPFDGLSLLFFRLGLTFMLSEITFQFIEKPIRNGHLERFFMQQKSFALWMFAGSMSLAGCSGLMIATEKTLENTPQYVINEAINEKAASLNEGALDVALIERAKNDAMCDVDETTQVIASENKLFLVGDQTEKESKSVKLRDIKTHSSEIKMQTVSPVQNRLQFERIKGKGYVNRVTTVEKAGEKSPVFLLGDSVMVGATDELVKRLPNASLDSQVGRQLSKGIQILNERKANNTLSDTVIIHLGNNSPINQHQIDDLVSLLTEKRKIVFVNLKLPRNYELSNNQLLDAAAKKHPNIRVVDWHSHSMNATNIFGKDGIHLLGNGAKLYAELIANALK